MSFPEGLERRNPGCRAILKDDGRKTIVPACMGAVGISGADSSMVGCNNFEECKGNNTVIPGKVRVFFQDDNGRVSHETIVNRTPLQNNSI